MNQMPNTIKKKSTCQWNNAKMRQIQEAPDQVLSERWEFLVQIRTLCQEIQCAAPVGQWPLSDITRKKGSVPSNRQKQFPSLSRPLKVVQVSPKGRFHSLSRGPVVALLPLTVPAVHVFVCTKIFFELSGILSPRDTCEKLHFSIQILYFIHVLDTHS